MSNFAVQEPLVAHKTAVECVKTFVRDGTNYLISAARDNSLVIFNLDKITDAHPSGTPVKRLTGHNHIVSAVDVTQDGAHAASVSWDGSLRIWDLVTGSSKRVAVDKKDLLTVAFAKEDKVILVGGRSNTVYAFAVDGKKIASKTIHKDWIQCVAAVPSTEGEVLFVTASWDRVVKLCKLESGNITVLRNFTGICGYASCVVPSPDGKTIFAAGKDGKVFAWSLEGATEAEEMTTLFEVDTNMVVHDIVVDSEVYRLFAIGDAGIKVINVDSEGAQIADEIAVMDKETERKIKATSGAQSANNLYVAGFDGSIFAYSL